jgi:hypothetical protein
MPITIPNLVADRATVTAWCSTCQTYQDFPYDRALGRFPPHLTLAALQGRWRCRACRGPGETWVAFYSDAILSYRLYNLFTFNNRLLPPR